MTHACAAGVDVGRDFFDVGLAPSGQVFRTANGPGGIQALVGRLERAGVSKVVLESIGGYAARLVRALAEAGFEVGVIDPKRIRALRIAEGKRAKTDRLDARLIARFALIMQDAARPVPDAKAFEIRALSTRRRQLVEMAAMEKVRLKQTLDEAVADSCRQMISILSEERARVETRLQPGRVARNRRAGPPRKAAADHPRCRACRQHDLAGRPARTGPPRPQGRRQSRRPGASSQPKWNPQGTGPHRRRPALRARRPLYGRRQRRSDRQGLQSRIPGHAPSRKARKGRSRRHSQEDRRRRKRNAQIKPTMAQDTLTQHSRRSCCANRDDTHMRWRGKGIGLAAAPVR